MYVRVQFYSSSTVHLLTNYITYLYSYVNANEQKLKYILHENSTRVYVEMSTTQLTRASQSTLLYVLVLITSK
jgi:hypothetical protein